MTTIAIDFETYYAAGYDLRAGLDPYLADPRFKVICVAVHGAEGVIYSGPPERCPWERILGADLLLAHNIGFERAVLRRLGLDPGPVDKWADTASLCAYLQAPRKLEDGTPVLIPDLPPKMKVEIKGKQTADADTLEYNRHDARLCWELWNRYGCHWPVQELEIARLTVEWAERGTLIDEARAHEFLAKALAIQQEVADGLPWTPKLPPLSPKAVKRACEALGIPAPPKKTDNEDAFEEWVKTHGPVAPWITQLSRYRSASALAARIKKLIDRRRPDGRVRAELFYYGAWTGRWTSAGGINFQNQRRKPFEQIDVRSLIIPRTSCSLLVADLSQIEARVIQWLAGNHRFLDLIRSGLDPYQATALQLNLWDGKAQLAEDTRQLCKQAALSLGYGVGGEQFSDITGLDFSRACDFVTKWRSSNPEVTALWAKLEQAMRANLGGDFSLRLPAGRYLRFGKIAEGRKGELSAVTIRGQPPERFWGSKIAQAMTQAIARDIFAHGLLLVRRLDSVKVLFTSHDEVVAEVPTSESAELADQVKSALTTGPLWAPGLPLDSKVKILDRYTKA